MNFFSEFLHHKKECVGNHPGDGTRKSYVPEIRRLHTKEKVYQCDVCDAKFAQSSNLKKHKVKHTSDRPYKCKMCPSSSFSSQSNLRKHHLTKHLNMDLDEDNLDPEEGDDEFSMEESTSTDHDKTRFR